MMYLLATTVALRHSCLLLLRLLRRHYLIGRLARTDGRIVLLFYGCNVKLSESTAIEHDKVFRCNSIRLGLIVMSLRIKSGLLVG